MLSYSVLSARRSASVFWHGRRDTLSSPPKDRIVTMPSVCRHRQTRQLPRRTDGTDRDNGGTGRVIPGSIFRIVFKKEIGLTKLGTAWKPTDRNLKRAVLIGIGNKQRVG
jgi:hypothetical protein